MQNRTLISRNKTLGLGVGLLSAAVIAVGLLTGGDAVQANAADGLKVGTYNPQDAFEQYPARGEMMREMQAAQQKIQEAQQQGDQQTLMQLQQEIQQLQQETIQAFYKDVEEALPEIADKQGVKVVAMEVVYTSEDVESSDLTEQVVSSFE